jgi:hypothetical protein
MQPESWIGSSSTVLAPAVAQAATSPSRPAPSPKTEFSEVLRGLGSAIDQGELVVGRALGGGPLGKLDSAELIRLQASIYRYTEAVDLVGKMVDRACNAVRTTLSNSG